LATPEQTGTRLPVRLAQLLVVATLTACGTTPEQEPPAELTTFEPSATVSRAWGVDIGADQEYDVTNLRPFVYEQTVYAIDANGVLTAYTLERGKRLWRHKVGQEISTGVGGDGEQLWVATRDGEVLALSIVDGAQLWSARVASEILTVPVAADGRVVVRSIDGRVTTFDARSGERLWDYRSNVPVLSLRGVGEPLIDAGVVFLGLDNGRIVALNLNDGTLLWEQTVAAPRGRSEVERLVDVDSTPVSDGDALFVSGYQGRIVLFATNTGATRWSRDMSSNQPLALDGTSVYVADEQGVVWALDRKNGSALWKQDSLLRRRVTGVTPHAGYLAVGDFEGYVHWLSRTDGRFVARRKIDSAAIANAPSVYGELLLAQSRSGKLAALRIEPIRTGD
jgi:outer membrane protein assembly factor BamB